MSNIQNLFFDTEDKRIYEGDRLHILIRNGHECTGTCVKVKGEYLVKIDDSPRSFILKKCYENNYEDDFWYGTQLCRPNRIRCYKRYAVFTRIGIDETMKRKLLSDIQKETSSIRDGMHSSLSITDHLKSYIYLKNLVETSLDNRFISDYSRLEVKARIIL